MQQVTRKITGVAVLSVAAAIAATGVASADTSAGSTGMGPEGAARAKVNEQLRDIAKKYPESVQSKKGPLGLPVSSPVTSGLGL